MTNHEFVIRLFIPLVEKAKQNRHIDQPLIMHSDRGSQFTSEAYNQATAEMTQRSRILGIMLA